MPKIVFVCDNFPLTDNLNGVSALNYSHLRVLLGAVPGARVHVVVLNHYAGFRFDAAKITAEFGASAITVTGIDFDRGAHCKGRKAHLPGRGFRPLRYFYPFLTDAKVRELAEVLCATGPDLIWTEHLIANLAVMQASPDVPVVYGHHDFIWKVNRLRNAGKSWKKTLLNHVFRRAERQLIRANAFFAGGSRTELAEIRRVNPAGVTAFLPAAYDPVAGPPPVPPAAGIRVVHLGTLAATANRIGLERFLRVCWPPLQKQFPGLECLVVGDLGPNPPAGLTQLLQQPRVRTLGYVADLSGVLRPYDIFVVPYEHDTGTRTRIPVALNYRQVLVGTRRGSAGMNDLVSGENCILVDSLEAMVEAVARVVEGETDRVAIAGQGRKLFDAVFTAQGQYREMRAFLKKILPSND